MGQIQLFFILVLATQMVQSQSYLDSVKIIHKTNGELKFDGFVNEALWDDATAFSFHEYTPDWGSKDSLTTLWVTFDEDHLLIGYRASDENPERLIKRNLLRDGYYGDDYFAFQIDPNRTKKNAFAFSIYPTGARYDAGISNNNIPLGGNPGNRAYDMIWDGRVQTTKNGWEGEFKIPLSNLRFEVRDNKVVGAISGHRSIHYKNKVFLHPKVPLNVQGGDGMPSLKQPVEFVGLIPKKDIQVTPYLLGTTATRNTLGEDESYISNTDSEFDLGLDVRYGITQSLTLDATLNTDFSQVEIDDQIINLNRFSIFLPERRKFFQEQAGLFDFSLGIFSQLFYSRSIGIDNGRLVPIIGGLRLTGELGEWDIGALSLQTEGAPLGDMRLPTENFSVLRLRKKLFNDRSFLGLMMTNRIREGNFNSALGIDGLVSLADDNFIIGSLTSSWEGEHYDNAPFHFFDQSRFALRWEKRRTAGWFHRASYEYSGTRFNPGMGFLIRERYQNFYGGLNHGKFNTDREASIFQYQRWRLLNADLYTAPDLSKVQSFNQRLAWTGRFFSLDEVTLFVQLQYEFLENPLSFSDQITIDRGHYLFTYAGFSYAPGIQRGLKIPIGIEYGQFFDGTNLQLQFSPEWNISPHITLNGSWRLNYLNFKSRDLSEWITIPQLRMNLAYDLHLSGSLTAQYNSLADQVFTAARLRYNFRDGHDLYLVYNQDYNTQRTMLTPMLPVFNSRSLTLKYVYTFL